MLTGDHCANCGKTFGSLSILIGVSGNFCSQVCVNKYRTGYQKELEAKALKNFNKMVRHTQVLVRAFEGPHAAEEAQAALKFLRKIQREVCNYPDWLLCLSEVEE